MFSDVHLLELPYLELSQRSILPACPAIYFALDSENRVLYVGRATNLLARWKDHHRFDQLKRLSRSGTIKLAWLDCSSTPDLLEQAESYFLKLYHPLLNQTRVPAKKIIPSEITLQEKLTKIAKYILVFGIAPAQESHPPIICLKYFGWAREVNTLRRILKAGNQSTSLKWTETVKRKYGAWWKTSCNGVVLELGPWGSLQDKELLSQKAVAQKLAGIEILALPETALEEAFVKSPFLKDNYPGLTALEFDPIPLLWRKGFQQPTKRASKPQSLRSRPLQEF
ncbi:GIY-YIG nuclease family protein [Trichocoleus desertorum AS-A10]|uniref:GIY-YIG nuclease family protein n=1 Tax=Trichocoleus desertorum TaxID=1481672 RepID=UPI0032970E3C